jgi:cytidine deaminase
MVTPTDRVLLNAAIAVQDKAHAPFSNYPVGAAVRTVDGTIFVGVNVESASFSLTCCAERVALFTAVSAGHSRIDACAIVTDEDVPAPPCGACRQVLSEFGSDIRIVLGNAKGDVRIAALNDLLPESFTAAQVLTRSD